MVNSTDLKEAGFSTTTEDSEKVQREVQKLQENVWFYSHKRSKFLHHETNPESSMKRLFIAEQLNKSRVSNVQRSDVKDIRSGNVVCEEMVLAEKWFEKLHQLRSQDVFFFLCVSSVIHPFQWREDVLRVHQIQQFPTKKWFQLWSKTCMTPTNCFGWFKLNWTPF